MGSYWGGARADRALGSVVGFADTSKEGQSSCRSGALVGTGEPRMTHALACSSQRVTGLPIITITTQAIAIPIARLGHVQGWETRGISKGLTKMPVVGLAGG